MNARLTATSICRTGLAARGAGSWFVSASMGLQSTPAFAGTVHPK
jgi:hypothetical protein